MKRSYEFWVRFASVTTLVVVSLMILAKLWAWLSSGSAAMLGSLTDSLLDISATAINFFVLSYALRPADDDHRFGHGKAEALAGLGQAAFIAGSAFLLIFHSIDRLINPPEVHHSLLGVWVSLFAIAGTLVIVAVQSFALKQTQSIAVKADSLHYRGDLLLNLAVLVAILLNYWGVAYADPLFAIAIAGYLLLNCWQIANESAAHLMDKELPDDEKEKIVALATSHPDVFGVHDLRTRQGGKIKFIQLHLELDDNLPLVKAHQVSDEVERAIEEAFNCDLDVLIHQDPVSVARPKLVTS